MQKRYVPTAVTRLRKFMPLLLLLFGLVSQAKTANKQIRTIEQADNVLAIYVENSGLFDTGMRKLIVSVWSDGHIVWSKDPRYGGAPYRSGQMDHSKFIAFLERLNQMGDFSDKRLAVAYFSPDSRFTTIYVKAGSRHFTMQSSHELMEDIGYVSTMSKGLQRLQGRSQTEVLKDDPKDYQTFRATWHLIRNAIMGFVPDRSTASIGKLQQMNGHLAWIEFENKTMPSKPRR